LDRVTEKKTLVTVDTEKNIILIKGALPGPNGGLIEICK
jgi:ribosomal protein L3